jgi:hypothetical protein
LLHLSDLRSVTHPTRAVDLTISKNRFGSLGRASLIFRPDLGLFGEEGIAGCRVDRDAISEAAARLL